MERPAKLMPAEGLGSLVKALQARGFEVWAALEQGGALSLAPLESVAALPRGRIEAAEAGTVKLIESGRAAYFDHTLPMQGLKRLVSPPEEKLFETGADLEIRETAVAAKPKAVIGARPCDLAALETLTQVFEGGPSRDRRYAARRQALFLVSVNCARPAATCFCNSMGTGPRAESGFDLALTELLDDDAHAFLVEAGSEQGAALLEDLPGKPASDDDRDCAQAVSEAAAAAMTRSMVPDVESLLKQAYDHPQWQDVAERCLACANCTMVCPTCFCGTVEDRSSLDGATAERWRRWDSCFTLDFSYVHGGAVRKETASRYRQWITHKLSHWHDQFGRSGCVGCGRCIGWCPVGIDITAEAAAIAASLGAESRETV